MNADAALQVKTRATLGKRLRDNAWGVIREREVNRVVERKQIDHIDSVLVARTLSFREGPRRRTRP